MSWASDKAWAFARYARRPDVIQGLVEAAIHEAIREAVREIYDARPFTRAECARRLRAMLKDEAESSMPAVEDTKP